MFAVRECLEQMHCGDQFVFEHPSNASSWNKVHKLVTRPSVFRVEGPMCRWHLLSGESGFMRKKVSWLTNHSHLAQALEQWRENTSATEPDRHVQVKSGLASDRCPVDLVESFLRSVVKTFEAVKNSQMWQHLRQDRHRMKILSCRRSLCRRRAWRSASGRKSEAGKTR